VRIHSLPLLVVALAAACAGPSKEVRARQALGAELVRRGDWRAAFGVVNELCREDPHDANALMLRGIIYTEQRLLPEAEADLKEAVRLEPKLARAHSALAILYDIEHKPKDAIEHHQRAVELAPRDPGYLNNLAFSLFAAGRPREAIPIFHEALREAPTDVRVRNNLGFAYAAAGDLANAAQQFTIAGSPAAAKNNLAWAYERRGSLAQAYDLYVEAVRLDPADEVARRNLSRVAQALGREVPRDLAGPGTQSRGGAS
jgi:Flp pilus assembly protein TadD